jgi:hypothetical protein
MRNIVSLHDVNITIMIIVSITLVFIIKSGYNPKIKWSNNFSRYCFFWEAIEHTEEIGEKDRYDFILKCIKLPKFLNILKNDRL